MEALNWFMANYEMIISNAVIVVSALMAVALAIPGEQPEKTLKAISDFLAKFSKKPKV